DCVIAQFGGRVCESSHDGKCAYRARGRGCAGEGGGDVVSVLESRDGAGEGWIGIAIQPACVCARHGQSSRSHCERSIARSNAVIGKFSGGISKSGNNRKCSYRTGRRSGARKSGRDVVTVLDAGDG